MGIIMGLAIMCIIKADTMGTSTASTTGIMEATTTATITTSEAAHRMSVESTHMASPGDEYELELIDAGAAELRFNAFDTRVRLRAFGETKRLEAPLLEALEACRRYEALFSRTLPRSDVWRINESHGDWIDVDPKTYELVGDALGYCAASHGAFDITVGALIGLWDFKRGIMPSDSALQDALAHVDWHAIEPRTDGDEPQVRLKDPQACIDLGGIAKGWIADALRDLLLEREIDAFVIDLGGNILVEGDKPNGAPWIVGLPVPTNGPRATSTPLPAATITLRRGSVVTSGVYERSFTSDGMRYHHILDPRTGMPVQAEYPAVSVVCERSIDAEGFSTTMLALGFEKSLELAAEHLEILQAYFISWNGTPTPLLA